MTAAPILPAGVAPPPFDARTADPTDYRAAKGEMVAASLRRAMQPRAAQDTAAVAPAPTGAELGNTSPTAATPAAAVSPDRLSALKLSALDYATALAKLVPGHRRR